MVRHPPCILRRSAKQMSRDSFEFKHLDMKWSYATNGSVAKATYSVPDSAYILSLQSSWNTVNKCTSCQKISSVLHTTQTSSFFSNHSMIESFQSKPSNLEISFRSNFLYITKAILVLLEDSKSELRLGETSPVFVLCHVNLNGLFNASKIFHCLYPPPKCILVIKTYFSTFIGF